MQTDENGIITEEEIKELGVGVPACLGGDSEHDRITHLEIARRVAQAQRQADVEGVRNATLPIPLVGDKSEIVSTIEGAARMEERILRALKVGPDVPTTPH